MKRSWMVAEFADAEELVRAVQTLRKQGYQDMDAYAPYPVHELEAALSYRRSRLPTVVFVGGMLGAGATYFFQWAINVELYPLNVGGRPYHFPLAFLPITFEMGVLFAALTGFFSILVVGRLLRLWRPIFELDQFRSASRDHFWLQLVDAPTRVQADEMARALYDLGALNVARVGDRSDK